jgi:hypothetical protein
LQEYTHLIVPQSFCFPGFLRQLRIDWSLSVLPSGFNPSSAEQLPCRVAAPRLRTKSHLPVMNVLRHHHQPSTKIRRRIGRPAGWPHDPLGAGFG